MALIASTCILVLLATRASGAAKKDATTTQSGGFGGGGSHDAENNRAPVSIADLLLDYDGQIRPGNGGSAVEVKVKFSPLEIKWKDNKLKAKMFIEHSWTDQRLKYTASTGQFVRLPVDTKIWMPDTYFHNAKDVDKVGSVQKLQLNPDGKVEWAQMVKATFGCPITVAELATNDGTQTCTMKFRTFTTDKTEVNLSWDQDDATSEATWKKNGASKAPVFTVDDSGDATDYNKLVANITIDTGINKNILDYIVKHELAEL